jgi:ribonuclease J
MPADEDYTLEEATDDLAEAAKDAVFSLSGGDRDDDDAVEAAISRAVKKAAFRIWKRRPVVEATVLRV